jgi:hypothetical protein
MSFVKNLFQLSTPQEIIFCYGKSDHHKAQASIVQRLLDQAFSEQNYRYIPLEADRFSIGNDTLEKNGKLFSTAPPGFVIDDPKYRAIDECQNWGPLQQKCRAIAFIYVLKADSFAKMESQHIKKIWNSFHQAIEIEDEDNMRIIIIKENQKALTTEQIQDLKYVINCRIKTPALPPLKTRHLTLSPEFLKQLISIVISILAVIAIGRALMLIYNRLD